MLTIYHLEQSRSGRVIWLAEELGLEYSVEIYKRTLQHTAPDEYKALHPLGRSPLIRDSRLVLAESGAIFDYLLGRYDRGALVPDRASDAYVQYLHWMHFGEGTLMPHVVSLYLLNLVGARSHPMWKAMLESLARDLAYAEDVLSRQPYLAGEQFTACDIVMGSALQAPSQFQAELPAHPRVAEYRLRLEQRPAFQKARVFK
jgi:glutathione S-transferase